MVCLDCIPTLTSRIRENPILKTLLVTFKRLAEKKRNKKTESTSRGIKADNTAPGSDNRTRASTWFFSFHRGRADQQNLLSRNNSRKVLAIKTLIQRLGMRSVFSTQATE